MPTLTADGQSPYSNGVTDTSLSRNVSPEGNNVNCRNVIIIAQYLQKTIGTESSLFSDLPFTREYLMDEVHWIPLSVYTTIIKRAKIILNDPDAPYHIGLSAAELGSWGESFLALQKLFAGVFYTPAAIYRRLAEFSKHFNHTKDFEIVALKNGSCTLKVTFKPHIDPNDDIESDFFIRGILAGIPTIWHLPHAVVTVLATPYDGAAHFLYRITWKQQTWFQKIRTLITHGLTRKRAFVETADHQLAIIRRYAEGLEDIVEQRTRELAEEKEKVEDWRRKAQDLLYGIMPQEVAEAMVRQELTPRHLYATALFSDLAGFTSYAKDKTPDEVATQLNDYFNHMKDIVLAHGGWINKLLGDGMFVIFGINGEAGHEHQAARAALEMQSKMHLFPWGMRIGIHAGEMMIGQFGTERLRRFDCIGHAINIAARLQGVAEKGQVVVSDVFAPHIRDWFVLDEGTAATLKGIGDITVYRVLKERDVV